MNLVDYALPIIGAGYYLLILKGVVKLPPARQQRFDNFVRGKETTDEYNCLCNHRNLYNTGSKEFTL